MMQNHQRCILLFSVLPVLLIKHENRRAGEPNLKLKMETHVAKLEYKEMHLTKKKEVFHLK